MEHLVYFIFRYWNFCWVIAFALILLRADRKLILRETAKLFIKKDTRDFIYGILYVYFAIPLTIPASIKKLTKKI